MSDEAQEASSGGAEAAAEEASSSFQELFEIQAEGIDYLSVEGIHIPEGVTVTMVGKDSESGFWKQVHAGAEQAVEDLNTALGYTGDAKAELIYDASAAGDVAEQIDIIDQMLDKNPDALICLLYTSSEMTEILRMSDRIVVMCEGRKTGELGIEEATQERIMHAATLRN